MQLMTSVMTAEDNCPDDFEEGEILDDDCPVSSVDKSVVSCPLRSEVQIFKSGLDLKLKYSNNDSNRVKRAKYGASKNSQRADPCPLRRPESKSKENKSFKVRDLRYRSEKYLERQRYTPVRKRFSDKEVRKTISGLPYEHQLRDFKLINSRRKERRSSSCDGKKKSSVSLAKSNDSGTSLLKRLVGSGSLGIKLSKLSQSDGEKSDKSIDAKDNISVDVTRSFSESACEITQNEKGSSEDDDELNLRMEALKTAMLKKHLKRKEQGITICKKSCLNDSTLEGVLSSPVVCDADNGNKDIEIMNSKAKFSDKLSEKSGDSFDCCDADLILSSENSPSATDLSQEALVVHKCASSDNLNLASDGSEPPIKKMKIQSPVAAKDDESVNEMELRQLALMSCWPKNKNFLQLDIDGNVIENGDVDMRSASSENPKGNKKNSSEDWEEVDENILRAQLLQTLSDNLPSGRKMPAPAKQIKAFTLKSGQPNTKKELDLEFEMKCKMWSEKMVPRLIISLASDSDSDTDDIEKSVDKLLQEARSKCDKLQIPSEAIASKFQVKRKVLSEKSSKLQSNLSSTPLAMKHLPIHRQEEYKRLKIKLAEKERLRKAILTKQISCQSTKGGDQKKNELKGDGSDPVETRLGVVETVKEEPSEEKRMVDDSLTIMCQSAREVEKARACYDENLSCIERLKKELHEAEERLSLNEKTLLERGADAHNHWVTCCQNIHRWISSKCVPESEKDLVKRTLDQEYQRVSEAKLLPHNKTKESLDPDGVLCPFHLSGCCKDPSCTFQHIELLS